MHGSSCRDSALLQPEGRSQSELVRADDSGLERELANTGQLPQTLQKTSVTITTSE